MLGAAVFLALLVVGALAPHLISASVVRDVRFADKLAPPDARHWFGTDDYGRDLFSMVLLAANLDLARTIAYPKMGLESLVFHKVELRT